MMNENTAAHELTLRLAGEEQHAIFFVGYADPSTPAGHIRAGQRGDMIDLDANLPKVLLDCPVEVYDFSGTGA